MSLSTLAPVAAASVATAEPAAPALALTGNTSAGADDRAEVAAIRRQAGADRKARQEAAAAQAQARQEADARARADAEARASRAATRTPAAVPAPAPAGSAQAVVAYARAQLGKPYVYGAAGPNSFDCSGLTMRAYEQIGVRLGHYTGAQMEAGRRVPRGELAIGDLVFPDGGHVGIYVGSNQILHAPQPGDVVKVSTIWSFYTAVRLV